MIAVTFAVLIPVFLLFRFTPLGFGDAAAAESGVQSTGRHSCRPDVSLGWGLAAAIGAMAGMMAAPLVYLDPDMMSGIQEINDRTNDSSLVTFQTPPYQVSKGNPVKA
jgi:branched-chain amino acid transport system permease protein